MGLPALPHAKWAAGVAGDTKEPILNQDFIDIESAILSPLSRSAMPGLLWIDNATVRVPATADSPAQLGMTGFPNILNPSSTVQGLSDGIYRTNTANVSCIFGTGGAMWGNEKASQWYSIFATAADTDLTFALKAMPYLRVKSQASQVISLGTNLTPATGIGYGFTTDESDLVGGSVYFLSGASAGLMRTITHCNNDNSTGGTVTYGGAALTLAAGDWFIILPNAGVNFRRIIDVYNDSSSDLTIDDVINGIPLLITATRPWVNFTKSSIRLSLIGGGGGYDNGSAQSGNHGDQTYRQFVTITPGTLYMITIGGYGSQNNNGGTTSFGSLVSATGGLEGGGSPDPSPLFTHNGIVYGAGGIAGRTSGNNGVALTEF